MRGVIYTAIAGGFDDLAEPARQIAGVDYVCFTDNSGHRSGSWRFRPFDWFHLDPSRVAKRVKVLVHRYLPQYAWSLWVDGNVHVTGDLSSLLEEHLARGPLQAFRHPRRSCIYAEALHCIARDKDWGATIEAQIGRYRRELMPADLGLSENNVLLRHHHDPRCRQVMEFWWREISAGSRRDQLSLSYVLWKTGLKQEFFYAGERLLEEMPLFRRVEHCHEQVGQR